MRFSIRLIALFGAAPTIISIAWADSISCIDGALNGGVGDIPVHNPTFSINGQGYAGGPFDLNCGQLLGRAHDGYATYEGKNGGSATADFWITADSCMNIETGGVHHYCCPGKINTGVTTCNI